MDTGNIKMAQVEAGEAAVCSHLAALGLDSPEPPHRPGDGVCANCGKAGAHYVPPAFGDPGYYTCRAKPTRERILECVEETIGNSHGIAAADIKPSSSFIIDLNMDDFDIYEVCLVLEQMFDETLGVLSDVEAASLMTVQDVVDAYSKNAGL